MKLRRTFLFLIPMLAAALVLCLQTGCSSNPKPEPETAAPTAQEVAPGAVQDDHEHRSGSHGGIIVSIGRDNYHAEAVFEKSGILRLYLLGKDETNVAEVDLQRLTAFARLEGDSESMSFVLQPERNPDDAIGKTSQFAGILPEEVRGRKVQITIPSLRVAGERFRIGFTSSAEAHAEEPMPNKVAGDDERNLYLTPGGLYTEADIKANGNVTASQKFKGMMSAHDMHPKPGDKICPITTTKANAKFTWIIGGKAYEFCCPPCVDEFLKTAKERPSEIKTPEDYVQK